MRILLYTILFLVGMPQVCLSSTTAPLDIMALYNAPDSASTETLLAGMRIALENMVCTDDGGSYYRHRGWANIYNTLSKAIENKLLTDSKSEQALDAIDAQYATLASLPLKGDIAEFTSRPRHHGDNLDVALHKAKVDACLAARSAETDSSRMSTASSSCSPSSSMSL